MFNENSSRTCEVNARVKRVPGVKSGFASGTVTVLETKLPEVVAVESTGPVLSAPEDMSSDMLDLIEGWGKELIGRARMPLSIKPGKVTRSTVVKRGELPIALPTDRVPKTYDLEFHKERNRRAFDSRLARDISGNPTNLERVGLFLDRVARRLMHDGSQAISSRLSVNIGEINQEALTASKPRILFLSKGIRPDVLEVKPS